MRLFLITLCVFAAVAFADENALEFEDELFDEANRADIPKLKVIKDCHDLLEKCRKSGRRDCHMRFAFCVAGSIVMCGRQCILPYVMCIKGFKGTSEEKIDHCNPQMITCLTAHCEKAPVATLSSNGIASECKALFDDCTNAASGIIQKGQCVVQFSLCMAAQIVECAKDCVAPMLRCKVQAVGDFSALLKCNMDFVHCVTKGCSKNTTTAVATNDQPIMEQCQSLLDDCFNAADGLIQKGKCIVQFGICTAAHVVDCGKDCVSPMLLCKARGIGSFQKIIQCNIDFVSCVVGGCTKSVPTAGPSTEVAQESNGVVKTIGDVCLGLYNFCHKLAFGPIAKLTCFNLHMACKSIRTVGCANDCIPTFITCKLWAIGRIFATIKCYQDIISCATTCTAEKPEKPDVPVFPPTLSPTTDAVPEAGNGIIKTVADICAGLYNFCHKLAFGPIAKLTCFNLNLACTGIKAVDCGAQCVPAFIKCHMASIGKIFATLECYKNAIECAIASCISPPAFPLSPTTDVVPEASNGIIKTVADICNSLYDVCHKLAFGPIAKLTCFNLNLACTGIKAVDCGAQCVPEFVKCHLASIGKIFATLECYKNAIECAIASCTSPPVFPPMITSEDDFSPYKAAIADFEESNSIVTECKAVLTDCISKAGTMKEKAHCFIDLGTCIGQEASSCAKSCLMPFGMCQMAAGVTWPALMKCGKEFLSCSVVACMKNEETAVANEGLLDQCQELYYDCSDAASSIIQKAECIVQLGLCSAAKVVDCSKDCVAPMLLCKSKGLGSFSEIIKCNIEFVKCAVGGCSKEPETTSVTVENGVIETIADVCNMLHEECTKLAWTPLQKLVCFNVHVACVGIKTVGCSKDCIAPFITCHIWSIGRLFARIECYKKFIKCTIGGCQQNSTEIAPTNMVSLPLDDEMSPYEFAIQAVDNNSVSFTECKHDFFTCIKTTPDVITKLQCFTKLGKCVGGELIGCSAHCIPQFALCKYEAEGSWIKTAFCAAKFLTCAKQGCIDE